MKNTNQWVTVLTFTYSHEVAIARGRLESEGIDCFVQDELTAQVHPFYSNAIGGIKLQVKSGEVDQAIAILQEVGYIKEEDFLPDKKLMFIHQILSKIPVINKLIS